ncbi:hypothetical protein NP233_g387 [Leucocoprinus birnbaumii]|uniref:5'-Nucleotidase C-terminal domain-containing protein n=1 Tax=Leucocoprinus birnbaumii TaxID=56174 RepID=A0AAD5YYP1_9AGAR|nr:hypothetical protein NP233_g387 [Leucocoprinus birnbaumii]
MATTLNIAHFNDVYRISEHDHRQTKESVDVTKFASLLNDITSEWDGGNQSGITVFSGDLFFPSRESSLSRGGHMPPIMKALGVDVACLGNHEFDMGVPRMNELIERSGFPWLCSNIINSKTGAVPEPMKEVHIIERKGIRIGFVGLAEKEWTGPINGWPENFVWNDMIEVGKALSVKLRDPAGEYKCDLVIADIKVARGLGALSPTAQANQDITSMQGVDLILGGHDHDYWISKGISDWQGYDLQAPNIQAADDLGDILVVKSGTDFEDLSELTLTLKDTPAGSIRKKIIQEIKGKRIVVKGDTPVDVKMREVVDEELRKIGIAKTNGPVAITKTEVNTRLARRGESPIGNWFADCLKHSYDQALANLGYSTVDGVLMNAGGMRGSTFKPDDKITLGDLMDLLPQPDPMVVIEVTASHLFWRHGERTFFLIEASAFPVISGFRVLWDSSRPVGQRVLRIWLLEDSKGLGKGGTPVLVDKEEVLRTSTRKYVLMVPEYLSTGGDGYVHLASVDKTIISAEAGQSRFALIRTFLLGAQMLNKQLREKPETRDGLDSKSRDIIDTVEGLRKSTSTSTNAEPERDNDSILGDLVDLAFLPVEMALDLAEIALDLLLPAALWLTAAPLFVAACVLGEYENPGLLDCYEREVARLEGEEMEKVDAADKDAENNLPLIFAAIDGSSISKHRIMTSTLPPLVQAFSGSLGSASAGALTYPLDLVSARLQLEDPFDRRRKGGLSDGRRILRHVLSKHGVSALYDGLATDTAAKSLSNFFYFYFYTWLRGLSTHGYISLSLQPRKPGRAHKPGMGEELLLGFLAGVASRAISTPLNIITLRLQTEREDEEEGQAKALHSTSIVDTMRLVYREQGLSGFWRGFKTTTILSLNPSITLAIYQIFRRTLTFWEAKFRRSRQLNPSSLKTPVNPSPGMAFIGAAISNSIALAILYPIILAKTRLQNSSAKSLPEALMDAYEGKYSPSRLNHEKKKAWADGQPRNPGIPGLYQGLEMQILKGFLNQGVTFLVKGR